MGISRLSAYEIAGNKNDIVCGAWQEGELYGGIISRGPGHNYKLIVSTNAGYDSAEEAKQAMEKLVKEICDKVDKEFGVDRFHFRKP